MGGQLCIYAYSNKNKISVLRNSNVVNYTAISMSSHYIHGTVGSTADTLKFTLTADSTIRVAHCRGRESTLS